MGPFGRFKGKIVDDQDRMKGEGPSVFKMLGFFFFLMIPKKYFVVIAGPT